MAYNMWLHSIEGKRVPQAHVAFEWNNTGNNIIYGTIFQTCIIVSDVCAHIAAYILQLSWVPTVRLYTHFTATSVTYNSVVSLIFQSRTLDRAKLTVYWARIYLSAPTKRLHLPVSFSFDCETNLKTWQHCLFHIRDGIQQVDVFTLLYATLSINISL